MYSASACCFWRSKPAVRDLRNLHFNLSIYPPVRLTFLSSSTQVSYGMILGLSKLTAKPSIRSDTLKKPIAGVRLACETHREPG